MIIYNTTWLDHLKVHEQLSRDVQMHNITPAEAAAASAAYPAGFYTPNVFIRAGLFILTNIIFSCAAGFLALFILAISRDSPVPLIFLIGGISYFLLELMVKQKFHYRSGVDDALLWIAGGSALSLFFLLTDTPFNDYTEVVRVNYSAAFILLLSGWFTLRFADVLMSLICITAVWVLLGSMWVHTGAFGTATLPFLLIMMAGLTYFICGKVLHHKAFRYYRKCNHAVQVISLLLLYTAGNYFVVQQAGALLYDQPAERYQVSLGWFFWSWTVLIPFGYIAAGIRRKDAVLIRSGLILIAAAAFTFRNYYHVMAIEAALVLTGLFILAVAYLIINYLKTPKNGFTSQDLNEKGLADHLQLEALVVAAMPSAVPAPQADRFGGGSFGGGGASSDF